jgi:hypothetical protein
MKKLYILLAVVFASLAMTSCFDDPGNDILFQGNQVEFNAGNLPNGITSSFVRVSSTQTDVVQVQVNRVSTNAASPITVTIAADPTSTAVQGVHYSLPSNTLTIPAGVFVANFPVTVLTGNINPNETPNLVLRITGANGSDVSANYNDLTVRIRVICQSELAGTYSVFWEFIQLGNGSGGASQSTTNFVIAGANTVTLTAAGTGAYTMNDMSFGMYPGLYGDSRPPGRLNDACGRLSGPSTNVDQYNDPFTISGDRLPDGKLKITWSNLYGDGGTVILTKQ